MKSSYSNLKIELVETSFEKIKPHAVEFVASFYQNLFEAYPETQHLFGKTDMDKQGKKLLNSLILLVEGLRTPEVLVPILKDLGARHKGYGTVAEYYPLVGEILLQTFADYLQEDWTPEVAQAWLEIYTTTSQLMLEGAGVDISDLSTQPEIENPPSVPQISVSLAKETTPQLSTTAQIELVETSFEKIKPRAVEFVASFYENLFEAYPETQRLFGKIDMEKQGKKLLNSLILLVEGLRTPEALIPVLKDLGARHKGYGIVTEYYPLMGDILLNTFADYLQEDWTPEVAQAWLEIYTTTSNLMLEGAGINATVKLEQPEVNAIPFSSSIGETVSPKMGKKGRENTTPQQRNLSQVIRLILQPLKPLQNSFKYSFQKINEWFWESPTWLVALVIVSILVGVLLMSPEGSFVARLLGAVEGISIIVAIILYVKEIPDRKKEFHYQAWSVIDAAHGVKVSPARIIALQDLNQDGVALNNLDLPGAKLVRINLPKADLSEANLTKSDLNHADLNHANLGNALLARVNFTGANLSYANLGFAKLSYANLSSANLNYANLICADLRDTNLSGANLSNANLSGADLKNAYLTGANLRGATVSQYDLRGAYLKGAIMPDGSKHP
ncbi:globin domain-containing protein [Planktothrix sp. FACHB-1365]|uniref:globin domain-containing protein n=1 Tax=Planktothrix sp. FACHB-1365 TaxID=2692855 RepID=UPI0016848F49|nr:globin domain-containing protein [Planktothrix sp. FACHB-1365]MBD2484881.1 pentapeptide repeat-containing protein [Planktothrix sp. FACHB-1365]